MRTLVRGAAAVLFMLAMAFGLTSMTSQSAVAQAAPACQFIFDDNGDIIIQQGPDNCEEILAGGGSGTACQITEVNGEVLIQGPDCEGQFGGGPCQVTDLDQDGDYDTFQGGCRFQVEPTQVPPTQVPPTDVPPTQVPPTDVPGTEKPTEEPGVKPTDEPGKAEPTDEPETEVEVLPSTGQGHDDDGNGNLVATALLGIVGVVLAFGAFILRQRRLS